MAVHHVSLSAPAQQLSRMASIVETSATRVCLSTQALTERREWVLDTPTQPLPLHQRSAEHVAPSLVEITKPHASAHCSYVQITAQPLPV